METNSRANQPGNQVRRLPKPNCCAQIVSFRTRFNGCHLVAEHITSGAFDQLRLATLLTLIRQHIRVINKMKVLHEMKVLHTKWKYYMKKCTRLDMRREQHHVSTVNKTRELLVSPLCTQAADAYTLAACDSPTLLNEKRRLLWLAGRCLTRSGTAIWSCSETQKQWIRYI